MTQYLLGFLELETQITRAKHTHTNHTTEIEKDFYYSLKELVHGRQ